MKVHPRHRTLVLSFAVIAIAGLAAQDMRLRIGTVVPRSSLWFDTLQYIAQDWQRIVGPGLKVATAELLVVVWVFVTALPLLPRPVESTTCSDFCNASRCCWDSTARFAAASFRNRSVAVRDCSMRVLVASSRWHPSLAAGSASAAVRDVLVEACNKSRGDSCLPPSTFP